MITVKVDTQTVPVVATINLLGIDGNFQFVNSTIVSFLDQSGIGTNPNYQIVIIWTNRGGNQLVYYLTTVVGGVSYDIGVIFNLTSRATSIAYFKNNTSSPLVTSEVNIGGYREVPFLNQVYNQTFLAIDLAARSRYPVNIVGPVTKI